MNEFMSSMPPKACANCQAVSVTLRREGFVKIFQKPLSKKAKQAMAALGMTFESALKSDERESGDGVRTASLWCFRQWLCGASASGCVVLPPAAVWWTALAPSCRSSSRRLPPRHPLPVLIVHWHWQMTLVRRGVWVLRTMKKRRTVKVKHGTRRTQTAMAATSTTTTRRMRSPFSWRRLRWKRSFERCGGRSAAS